MKMWIAKYALSKGIFETEVEARNRGSDYVYPLGSWNGLKVGRDAFAEKEKAVERAEELREKKVKSLNKQVKTILALNFDA